MSNIAVRVEQPTTTLEEQHDHAHHEDGHGHGAHHGPANLHHHFTDLAQQRESNSLGMWVFLVTEVMTFGALFFVYTLYRHLFENQNHLLSTPGVTFLSPWGVGSHLLDNTLGFINTLVLLCSSLTVATAVHMAGIKQRGWLVGMLALTGFLGAVFLGIKSVEWYHDYQEKIVPGLNWEPRNTLARKGFLLATPTGVNGSGYVPGPATPQNAQTQWQNVYQQAEAEEAAGAGGTEVGSSAQRQGASAESRGQHDVKFQGVINGLQLQMFFVIYFCMTGLHAIHMIIGLGLISVFIFHARRGMFTESPNDQPVEIFGLYWHFVDIVWVFLYPLLYLVTLPVAR